RDDHQWVLGRARRATSCGAEETLSAIDHRAPEARAECRLPPSPRGLLRMARVWRWARYGGAARAGADPVWGELHARSTLLQRGVLHVARAPFILLLHSGRARAGGRASGEPP